MISSKVGECMMNVEWDESVLSPVRFNLLRLRSRWVAAATTRTLVRNSLFTSQKHTTVIIMDFPFWALGGREARTNVFPPPLMVHGLNVVRLNKASLYHRINRFILLTENSTTTTTITTTTTTIITIFKSINQNTKNSTRTTTATRTITGGTTPNGYNESVCILHVK